MVVIGHLSHPHKRDLASWTVEHLDDHRHGRVENIREVIGSTSPRTLLLPVFFKTVGDTPGR